MFWPVAGTRSALNPEVVLLCGDAQLARNAIGNLIGMGQVATIEGGKRKEPAPGYRFEFSNTHEYAMQVGTNVAWLDSAPMAGSGTMAA